MVDPPQAKVLVGFLLEMIEMIPTKQETGAVEKVI